MKQFSFPREEHERNHGFEKKFYNFQPLLPYSHSHSSQHSWWNPIIFHTCIQYLSLQCFHPFVSPTIYSSLFVTYNVFIPLCHLQYIHPFLSPTIFSSLFGPTIYLSFFAPTIYSSLFVTYNIFTPFCTPMSQLARWSIN